VPGQADGLRPAFHFGYGPERVPSFAVTVRFELSRYSSISSVSPGCFRWTTEKSWSTDVMGSPSTFVMMSPPIV
jgi:hypothetical protein